MLKNQILAEFEAEERRYQHWQIVGVLEELQLTKETIRSILDSPKLMHKQLRRFETLRNLHFRAIRFLRPFHQQLEVLHCRPNTCWHALHPVIQLCKTHQH